MKKAKNPRQAKKNKLKTIGFILLLIPYVISLYSSALTYPSSEILALLVFQPAAINLFFVFVLDERKRKRAPDGAVSPDAGAKTAKGRAASLKRKIKSVLGRVFAPIIKALGGIRRFAGTKRTVVVLILSALTLFGTGFYFWFACRGSFVSPGGTADVVIFAAVFVLFLIMDVWCKYAQRDVPEDRPRDLVVFGNLWNAIKIEKFIFLAAAAVSVVNLLGFVKINRIFFGVLCALFVFQTLAFAFLITVRFVKRELETNPDVRIRVNGDKNDLNLAEYLEKNTGISTRSLWSVSFIKKVVPYAAVFGAAVLWLCTGIVQIESYQKGALYRFGKLAPEVLEPGIHLTLPRPFDAVDVYDTESLREITVGYVPDDGSTDNLWTKYHGGDENKLLLGGGNELVSINLRIEYKISDLIKYLKCSDSPDALLESAAYEAVTAKTIGASLESLLTADRSAFSKSFEKELAKYTAPYESGLEVVDVVIESIHPPVEAAEMYQKIISAGIEADKIILEAQATAAVSIEEAKTSYDSDVNAALADRSKEIAAAKSSVAEFSASVKANKNYGGKYRYYKYLEALKKAYSNARVIIVGQGVDESRIYIGNLTDRRGA